MGSHRPPPPTLQQRLYWPIAVACGAVMLAGTIGAAQAVAPQVTVADEHLALTPERSAEPSAHGGPLAPLSIGVVAPETDVPVVPPIVRSSVRDGTPSHAQPGAPHQTDTVRASTVTTEAARGTTTTTQGATSGVESPTTSVGNVGGGSTTTTPPATTTRTCWWCHHTSPATTTETTTAATTTEATETTSETSDPLATLIGDVLEGPHA